MEEKDETDIKVSKNILIRMDQDNWLSEKPLNLSKFVRQKLDEEIEKRKE